MSALHFGAFYKLLKEPAAVMALPRPWRASDSRRATGGLRAIYLSAGPVHPKLALSSTLLTDF